jgi:DNA-binding transcriptional LysR family regulator
MIVMTRSAARGRLLTVVPSVMLRLGAKHLSIKALPIKLPANRRPVSLLTLKDRALSPVVRLFIERTREVAKKAARD